MKSILSFQILALLSIFPIFGDDIASQKKRVDFDTGLTQLKAEHVKFVEEIENGEVDPRTLPILFAFLNVFAEKQIDNLEKKNNKEKGFEKDYNSIKSDVKNLTDYLEFGHRRYIALIDSYLPIQTENYLGEIVKIGKLFWQSGDASDWEDCPVQKGYSSLHSAEICVVNYPIADQYCKKYKGRLPTIKEFEKSFKENPEFFTETKWPKYWTSDKKNREPAYIHMSDKRGGWKNIGINSLSSIRCVWDNIE